MSFNDLPDAYKVLTILRFYKQPATLKNEIGGDWNGKTNIYITDIFGHAAGITRSDYAFDPFVFDICIYNRSCFRTYESVYYTHLDVYKRQYESSS